MTTIGEEDTPLAARGQGHSHSHGHKKLGTGRPPVLSVPVHPELRKALRLRKVSEDTTMTEIVHVMLCHELGREDLVMQSPDPTPSRA